MSEFEPIEQEPTEDTKLRTELENANVSHGVINKIIKLRKDASSKLYAKEIDAARKIKVDSAGEISSKFTGQDISGRAAMRRVMFVALINGVLRPNTPFRRLWYQFVKASLQGLSSEFNIADAFYNAMTTLIKSTPLEYKDFGIRNVGDEGQLMRGAYEIKPEKEHRFPNVMIGIEDASYYGVFKNFAELLGLHRYSAGGQSNLSSAEVISDKLKENLFRNIKDETGWERLSDTEKEELLDKGLKTLNIRSVTDLDPAGYNIANAYLDHFSVYLGEKVTSKRFAPLMKHYTFDELVQNMYMVKLSTISQQTWEDVLPELKEYRAAYEKRSDFDFEDSYQWHDEAQDILQKHGLLYKKGVNKGLGKPPKSSDWNSFKKNNPDAASDIETFINQQLPSELRYWWTNIVSKEERPKKWKDDDIDLFRFIALNEYIYPYGVELASVPESPLTPAMDSDGTFIYDYKNPNFLKGSHHKTGSGQARMRLLTFDELVEEFGMNTALTYYFNYRKPAKETVSGRFISDETNEGMELISDINYNSRELLSEIDYTIDGWFRQYLEDERSDLESEISKWLDSITNKYLNPSSDEYDEAAATIQKDKIWRDLRNAVLNDETYIFYQFPETFDQTEYEYDEDFKLIIPPDIFESIKPIAEWSECIKLNIKELKKLLNNYDSDDLSQDWKEIIPDVHSCRINPETGKMEVYEQERDQNCDEYKHKIRELNDTIADLEGDIIDLKKQRKQYQERGETEAVSDCDEKLKEKRKELIECERRYSQLSESYRQLNTKYRERTNEVDKKQLAIEEQQMWLDLKEKEIEDLKKSYNDCITEKEKLEKIKQEIKEEIIEKEEEVSPEEMKKLDKLEDLIKKQSEAIGMLHDKITKLEVSDTKEKAVDTATQTVSKKEAKEILNRIEKGTITDDELKQRFSKDIVDSYLAYKDKLTAQKEEKMDDWINIFNEGMTGTEYFAKWNEKPPSWNDMRQDIPMERWSESRIIKRMGEDQWEILSDAEKDVLINKGLKTFPELQKIKEQKKTLEKTMMRGLRGVLGQDLPFEWEEEGTGTKEDYFEAIERQPFKFWYGVDVEDPNIFKKRIEYYTNQIVNDPDIIKKLEAEKIDRMLDVYAELREDAQKLSGEARYDKITELTNELNRLNNDVKKLHYYGT